MFPPITPKGPYPLHLRIESRSFPARPYIRLYEWVASSDPTWQKFLQTHSAEPNPQEIRDKRKKANPA